MKQFSSGSGSGFDISQVFLAVFEAETCFLVTSVIYYPLISVCVCVCVTKSVCSKSHKSS